MVGVRLLGRLGETAVVHGTVRKIGGGEILVRFEDGKERYMNR